MKSPNLHNHWRQGPDSLPPAYTEVWEPRYRRPVRSWLRVMASFLVTAGVVVSACLALIIVAAEVWR